MYIYIYIYIERERERESTRVTWFSLMAYIHGGKHLMVISLLYDFLYYNEPLVGYLYEINPKLTIN